MNKPFKYDLKNWLYGRIICSLEIHYFQTGTDTSATDWEITDRDGNSRRLKSSTIAPLVDIGPDWVAVLRLKENFIEEVERWDAYAKKEDKDLKEFERLKKKFSD